MEEIQLMLLSLLDLLPPSPSQKLLLLLPQGGELEGP